MPIKTSNKFKDVEKRLSKLPKFYENSMIALLKKDANKFIDQFQKNIRNNKLNIIALADNTIKRKSKQGMPKPETPLYGLGDLTDNSYINMFLLRKTKEGWKAYPRWAKHHKASLTLRQLFEIHEYGRTIRGRNGGLIRIPPRPVAWLTYKNLVTDIKKKEESRKIKSAIIKFVKEGNSSLLQKIEKYDTRWTE